MDFDTTIVIIGIVFAAGSEIIALVPSLKSNSWVQLFMNIAKVITRKKNG